MTTEHRMTPTEAAARRRARGGNLTHADRRTRRNRTRSAQRARAIREQGR